MFAPLILPLQITCIVVALLTLVATVLFERLTKRSISLALLTTPPLPTWVIRFTRYALSMSLAFLTGMMLFIPSLFVVGSLVDAVRYGRFEYSTGSQITDHYVEIPDSATNVTLHKYASGHALRFTVDEPALLAWMGDVVKRRGKHSGSTPFKIDDSRAETIRFDWNLRFGRYDWLAPEDVILYRGWRTGRGCGFDVWYSPGSQTAFINAGYW